MSAPDLHPEDAKLVTLARSARGRTGAPEGAAVRDTDGRTYVAATVDLPSLRLSAPAGESRLPKVLGRTELDTLLDAPPARVGDDPAPIRLRDDAVREVRPGDHRQPRERAVGHRNVDELPFA